MKTDFDVKKLGIEDPFNGPNFWERACQNLKDSYERFQVRTQEESARYTTVLLKVLNAGLFLVIAGLCVNLVYIVTTHKQDQEAFERQIAQILNYGVKAKPIAFDFTQARIMPRASRNVFVPYVDQAALQRQNAQLAESAQKELSAQLSVVGIMMDGEPTAIIEERKTGTTHIVSPADALQGAIVEKIDNQTVHLTYKGQMVVLSL